MSQAAALPDLIRDFERVEAAVVDQAAQFPSSILADVAGKFVPGRLNHPISLGGVSVRPGDLVVGDADGVTVIEREKAAAMLPLAAKKVADETQRIADIESRKALRPAWLDGALRAAGVIRQGESL